MADGYSAAAREGLCCVYNRPGGPGFSIFSRSPVMAPEVMIWHVKETHEDPL
jgi:hypothetical protein